MHPPPSSPCIRPCPAPRNTKGHVEFFVCDANDLDDPDGVVTQECLNKHPLTRAPYTGAGSPIDPSYPGRYYVDPPCRKDEVEQNISSNFVSDDFEAYSVKMSYVLPDIECEHCVLQMHYSEFLLMRRQSTACCSVYALRKQMSHFSLVDSLDFFPKPILVRH